MLDSNQPHGRVSEILKGLAGAVAVSVLLPATALAAGPGQEVALPSIAGIPVDFVLFGLTLVGVALFHHHTFFVALAGLVTITFYKLVFTGFKTGAGLAGLAIHLQHEWVILANLFLLLMGFALLARHFEKSGIPDVMPALLPDDWKGAFLMLAIVWFISSFLDNIAAALIGGTMAVKLFRGKVHIGYIAAIVAASNAGGAFSVVGDTTTTMMWIDGVSPLSVFDAIIASTVALIVCGIPAAMQQQRYSPIARDAVPGAKVDWARVFIVLSILFVAVAANVWANLRHPELLDALPVIGLGVWGAVVVTALLRKPDWELLGENLKGTLFLLMLVTCASMMPVEKLPAASWPTTMSLGFISAVFDNIPLTALALKQGGYDWGMLAYAVGFGGSMIWFGSSAGVAITNQFPEAKNAIAWVKGGWHVAIAYVVGFLVMLAVLGWRPDPPHRKKADAPAPIAVTVAMERT
ncbi:MAG TPA: citrate transporter [Hyphomicrobiaceae bacterium]|nr:citrate transporter [Hyphomicrobiaceae bacterium]